MAQGGMMNQGMGGMMNQGMAPGGMMPGGMAQGGMMPGMNQGGMMPGMAAGRGGMMPRPPGAATGMAANSQPAAQSPGNGVDDLMSKAMDGVANISLEQRKNVGMS